MAYKIVIKGGYGLTNFGDDALMYVLAEQLAQYFDKSEIAFACYPGAYAQRFSSGFSVIKLESFKSTPTNVLLYGGGTQFYSFRPERPFARKCLSTLKKLVTNPRALMGQSKPTSGSYKRCAAIGIGVGPFLESADRAPEERARIEFESMDFVAVRDTFSARKTSLWRSESSKVYADICYLMDSSQYDRGIRTKLKSVAIVVRDWNETSEGQAYYDKVESLVRDLESKGYSCTLVLFAPSSDKYWNVQKNKFANILEWNPEQDSVESFMEVLADFDLFVTARFHGAIFASLLGIPFISIGVEQKLELVSQLFESGAEHWGGDFEVNECLAYIDSIEQNYEAYQQAIRRVVAEQQLKAHSMLEDFMKFYNVCRFESKL